MKVEELSSSSAYTTRHAFANPSNSPNAPSGGIAGHHPIPVKYPFKLELAGNFRF
jgi:hypothetical protein